MAGGFKKASLENMILKCLLKEVNREKDRWTSWGGGGREGISETETPRQRLVYVTCEFLN